MKISELIKQKESEYITGTTKIGKYVNISLHEIIENIIAYLNSKHLSGDKDSLGREKPFFNIITSAVNIWYRATDIDRKNIRVKATKSRDTTKSLLATILLQEWMKKVNFGTFLNEWGRTLAQYGSAIVKFVEKKGVLYPTIVQWNKIIVDSLDFENNVKIEKLYLSAKELQERPNYDKQKVKELLEEKEKQVRKNLQGETVDSISNFFEVYELHGYLPKYHITDNPKDTEIVHQMHIISYVADKDGKEKDFTLYKGISDNPYILTHLIKEPTRTLGIGAVEYLFDAQWMVNHTIKQTKDVLDFSSKIFFQTADQSFTGVNTLTDIETGDIMINDGNPISQVNNASHDTTSLANYNTMWQTLAKELTSTPDALRGNTFPSGTAYRQVAMLNQEANSLFELMTENKGLYLEEMLRTFVIPHIKKKMDTSEEIAPILEGQNLTRLDKAYIDAEVVRRKNSHIKKFMLKDNGLGGEVAPEFDVESVKRSIQSELTETGNQRFIKPSDIDNKTWKDVLKDLEWDLDIEITNESVDKGAIFETLTTLFQIIRQNEGKPLSPEARIVFSKILEETGKLSPVEVSAVNQDGINTETTLNQNMQNGQNMNNQNPLAGIDLSKLK